MIKKWEQVGEATVLAGKFGKKLIVKQFINPNTGKVEEYVQFAQREWSVCLAITSDGQVLVESEFKQGRNDVGDELPAGTAEFDETPETVMRRELREETGYEAGKMEYLGFGYMSTRNSPTKFHCFLATDCKKAGPAKLDENEDIETRLVSLREWINMTMSGKITEPSAMTTTLLALPYLNLHIVLNLEDKHIVLNQK